MERIDEFLRHAQIVWEKLPSIFLWGQESTGLWFATTLVAHLLLFASANIAFAHLAIWVIGLFFDIRTPPSRSP